MYLRKINAGLSLLTTLLFLDHAIFLSVWMLSRCSIEKSADNMPFIFLAVTVVHAVLSILLMVLGYNGAEKCSCRTYPKLNIPTYVQRITGILMALLFGLHLAGAANHFQPKMLHAVLHPLFFALCLAHIAVSVSKSLITLGIGNARVVRVVDIIMRLLCIAIFAASVIGFYMCLFLGVAR